MDKEYRTRGGKEVIIYATDIDDSYPVVGVIVLSDDSKVVETWTPEGNVTYGMMLHSDLIEVKPRIIRIFWVNVYDNYISRLYTSRREADTFCDTKRTACIAVNISCEHGEGLDEENT